MPPRTSRSAEGARLSPRAGRSRRRGAVDAALGLALLTALVAAPRAALAQACCVAPGAAGASRLAPHESFLTGVDARAQTTMGTFDAQGRFRGTPAGTRDIALEQNIFMTARLLSRGQLTAGVPLVQTVRSSGATSSSGGGVGDVRASARWDLVRPEDAGAAPGVAVVGGVALPTGRPPEQSSDVLGTDATGTGTTQVWGGLSLEKTWGPWLALAVATVNFRADREVSGTRSSIPPRYSLGVITAHAWRSGVALSFGATYALEDRARVDGVVVAGSARRALILTTALQIPLGPAGRLVGTVFATPPIPAVSAGDPAPLGLSLALVKPWG